MIPDDMSAEAIKKRADDSAAALAKAKAKLPDAVPAPKGRVAKKW